MTQRDAKREQTEQRYIARKRERDLKRVANERASVRVREREIDIERTEERCTSDAPCMAI